MSMCKPIYIYMLKIYNKLVYIQYTKINKQKHNHKRFEILFLACVCTLLLNESLRKELERRSRRKT